MDLPEIDDALLTALICGLRDPSPETAEAAHWSLARKEKLRVDDFRVGLILSSLQFAATNPDASVRRGAAALSVRLRHHILPGGAHASNLDQTQRSLANDICYSVRAQINLVPPPSTNLSSNNCPDPDNADKIAEQVAESCRGF